MLREKTFKKLFSQAAVAKLNPEEIRTYGESLKIYRDNYSVIETAKHESREQGRLELSLPDVWNKKGWTSK